MSPRSPVSAQSSNPMPQLDGLEHAAMFPHGAALPATGPSPGSSGPSGGHLASSIACLAGVVAGELLAVRGALALTPEGPLCGATRAQELEAHQRPILQGFQRGELRQGLRELAVALGLAPHRDAPVAPVPPIDRDGDVAPVTVLPPEPPIPQAQPAPTQSEGAVRRVEPTPTPTLTPSPTVPHAPIRRGGRPMATTPHRDLQVPSTRGARRPVGF
ncbi:MAG: hypothetical protein HY909_14445 [Deltaproteobacteria bacterium]|nr:hypothetical protein [Deltaproteobacteria bacterium]